MTLTHAEFERHSEILRHLASDPGRTSGEKERIIRIAAVASRFAIRWLEASAAAFVGGHRGRHRRARCVAVSICRTTYGKSRIAGRPGRHSARRPPAVILLAATPGGGLALPWSSSLPARRTSLAKRAECVTLVLRFHIRNSPTGPSRLQSAIYREDHPRAAKFAAANGPAVGWRLRRVGARQTSLRPERERNSAQLRLS